MRRRITVALEVARARDPQLRRDLLLEERQRVLRRLAGADLPRELAQLGLRRAGLVGRELAAAIPSAFIATSVRNRCAVVVEPGSTSCSEELAHRLDELLGVGRSWLMPPLDQVEQLVLHLRGQPAEHRVLDAAVLAR